MQESAVEVAVRVYDYEAADKFTQDESDKEVQFQSQVEIHSPHFIYLFDYFH